MVSARALHYVLKIGDRGANINFFRNILGMKVINSYYLLKIKLTLNSRGINIRQWANKSFMSGRCFY